MSAADRRQQAGREVRIEGLTIERYAEVMAYRRHFPAARAAEVLLRLGIQPARWDAATRAWGTAMSMALTRDEPELLTRFARALAAQERRLREFPPRIESLGEPVAQHVGAEGGRGAERPSYLREEAEGAPRLDLPADPPPAAPHAAPRFLQETADIGQFVPRPVLPFHEADPAHGPNKKG